MSYEIVVQSEPIVEMQKTFGWYEYREIRNTERSGLTDFLTSLFTR